MSTPDGPRSDEPIPGERFLPGRILADRYRVVARIGEGGMGEVFRAYDLKLGQTVALKFLPQELSNDATRLAALFAEVRLARQVSHPGVCRVHDVNEADGMHFLSMEFVDGEDLGSLLRRIGRLPPDKATEIAREICTALAAIHDRGLLHRDLKPANLMIDGRGHVRITDFGLAELQGASTDPGMIVGTPAYMAPECLAGSEGQTVQGDLYGLGLVLYELFTGRRPFEATQFRDLLRQRRETTPTSPAQHQRDIDPKVEAVIMRCLQPDADQRPRSALAVAAALPGGDPISAAIAAGETPSPEQVAAVTPRAEGLRPAAAWSCMALLVAGLTAVVMVAPHTRLVPALSLPEPPEAMTGRAREILRSLGFAGPAADRAFGLEYDDTMVDEVVASDRSPLRWRRLAQDHPLVVTFWYREHSGELVPSPPNYRVSYSDPPRSQAGMVGIRLDGHGRLRGLDAPANPGRPSESAPLFDPSGLFAAAGLNPSDFHAAPIGSAPLAAGDELLAYEGHDRRHPTQPLRVEVVAFQGRPVSFVIRESALAQGGGPSDPSGRTTSLVQHTVRPTLILAAMLLGAWLARRNLRARRGDTKRALRLGIALMTARIVLWILGGHPTLGSATEQLMTVLAWGLYDFAYGWLIYIAIEPFVRRLWPRWLTSWARLLDGRHADPRVGGDLLVGCLVGTGIALAVAAHQAAPVLFGAPPGRPDNVGYIEGQLAALLGLRAQLADLLSLVRSNVILLMGFVVILVMARLVTRRSIAALVIASLLFVPLGLPKGEFVALNFACAACVTLALLCVILRFGLLAAGAALITHAALEATPLGLGFGAWPTLHVVLVPALVLGVGGYGFFRALGGRAAFRDMLADE